MSSKLIQPVRGTHDVLPEETRQRRHLIDRWRAIAETYGYGEIQTPLFESSDVFHRTLGDTSDVVTKETYTFTDRGGDSVTLRPEFTASVVRAFLTAGLTQDLPQKFFYAGPAFRYERPQKGRLRQFHQIGCELIGSSEPEADIETIALAMHGLRALGLEGLVTLELNSLGDAESRAAYRHALVKYYEEHKSALSEDSRTRLEKNPLRILDSKDEGDKKINANAPQLTEHFTPAANDFFARVQVGLQALNIPYTLNHRLVRGLDYYNHTVFEFTTTHLGAQGTVLAGGRYDGLVAQMGGPEIPGVGFAAGVERLHALIDWTRVDAARPQPVVAVVPVGDAQETAAWKLVSHLREAGIAVDIAFKGNVGKRLKRADKIGALCALMLGEEEAARGEVALKNLKTGEQRTVALATVAEAVIALFKA